jgi:lipid-binding SYLF domain-containing protein
MKLWLPALLLVAQAQIALAPPALAAWEPDPGNPLQVASARTIAEWRAADPALEPFFAEACALAVFPRVVQVGFGAGVAWGRGLLIAGDRLKGEVSQSALSLGLQAGGEAHSQVIFFRTCEAVDLFTKSGNLGFIPGRLELGGRASAAAATRGAAAEAAFSSDVAIFSRSRGGLMAQLAAAGVRYRFTPRP